MLTSVYRMQMMAHSTCMVEQILWLPLAKVVISSHEYGSIVCHIYIYIFESISERIPNEFKDHPSKTLPDPDVARGLSWVPPPFPHALLAGMPAFFPVSLFNLQGSMRKHTGKNFCPLKDWTRKMVDGIHLSVPFKKPHPQIHCRVWVSGYNRNHQDDMNHENSRCFTDSLSTIRISRKKHTHEINHASMGQWCLQLPTKTKQTLSVCMDGFFCCSSNFQERFSCLYSCWFHVINSNKIKACTFYFKQDACK